VRLGKGIQGDAAPAKRALRNGSGRPPSHAAFVGYEAVTMTPQMRLSSECALHNSRRNQERATGHCRILVPLRGRTASRGADYCGSRDSGRVSGTMGDSRTNCDDTRYEAPGGVSADADRPPCHRLRPEGVLNTKKPGRSTPRLHCLDLPRLSQNVLTCDCTVGPCTWALRTTTRSLPKPITLPTHGRSRRGRPDPGGLTTA